MIYPVGVQNFEKIRKEGYVYVDKTALIHRLVKSGTYYFLSRPRRFGKSLLISTLEAYFSGKKHLFEGLAIEDLETEWNEYPVLHFDLNAKKFDAVEDLYELVGRQLERYELQYETVAVDQSLDGRFYNLVMSIADRTHKRVVILVDEYDKPLLQTIGNSELQNTYREILKAFYGVMKSCDGQIHFGFLTGVTKFGKVSVFSDLNNLDDISMDPAYYDICGISEDELNEYFDAEIGILAEENDITKEQAYDRLRNEYDGYHFCENVSGVYNPFSVLSTLRKNRFGNYWFETGTPTYLVELLKRSDFQLDKIDGYKTGKDVLNGIDPGSPVAMIYQSGYVTIKDYDSEFDLVTVGFPNKEVERGFLLFLLPFYTNLKKEDSNFFVSRAVQALKNGDAEVFMSYMKSLLAGYPYDLIKDTENHYQNVVYLTLKLMSVYLVDAEFRTSDGRIDLLVRTDKYIYVMEFKYNGSAQEAMDQIESKDYPLPFAMDSRTIIKVGVNFSGETRNIDNWIIR
ncbi:MAG: ATP-binding protein [Bacteroidales bacterium]|nr:ATP-binding protein [Bacteroidales bacterium]MBQ8811086.1 ATP-binding protein [Bacteroidales bacterium]